MHRYIFEVFWVLEHRHFVSPLWNIRVPGKVSNVAVRLVTENIVTTSQKQSIITVVEHNVVWRWRPIVKIGPKTHWICKGKDHEAKGKEEERVGEVNERLYFLRITNLLILQISLPLWHYDWVDHNSHDNHWRAHANNDQKPVNEALDLAFTQLVDFLLDKKLTTVLLVLVQDAEVAAQARGHVRWLSPRAPKIVLLRAIALFIRQNHFVFITARKLDVFVHVNEKGESDD